MTPRCGALALVLVVLGAGCSRKPEATSQPTAPSSTPLPLERPEARPRPPGGPVAFPGAEGFGATTRGGRGGKVCLVTSLAKEGTGTLGACLAAKGPRTVIFRVGGVVEGPLAIIHGEVTIAGQTAPGGVTVKGGLVCDNVYDAHECDDVILRHVRLRGGEDGLRLGGTHHVVVDHVSIANASDESLEITRSHDVTVQYSTFAEPVGDHYKWGGVLVNYAKDVLPLDAITLHHDVWNGVAGRLPELSCEENDDGPGKTACKGRTLRVELSYNVAFDAHDPVWFNRCTTGNAGNDCPSAERGFSVAANVVGNLLVRRSSEDADAPFVEPVFFSAAGNKVYFADNRTMRGAVAKPAAGTSLPVRHPYPIVSSTEASRLVAELAARAGAFPRDAMDTRLASYLSRPVDARPRAWENEKGIARGDAYGTVHALPAPADGDSDGMPDAWEKAHGLDPAKDDSADLACATNGCAKVEGCTSGYTALECYLNELAHGLVH